MERAIGILPITHAGAVQSSAGKPCDARVDKASKKRGEGDGGFCCISLSEVVFGRGGQEKLGHHLL